jgi:hypothetical protein
LGRGAVGRHSTQVYKDLMKKKKKEDYGCQKSCYKHEEGKHTINQEENNIPTF